jgi:hypothetical protein
LFDFVQPGLLGDVREFNRCGALRLLPMMMYVSQLEHCREFSNVIEQRNAKDASESDRLRGQQRAEELQVHLQQMVELLQSSSCCSSCCSSIDEQSRSH